MKEFVASMKGQFSNIFLKGSCCNKIENGKTLLSLIKYFSVHQTKKNVEREKLVLAFTKQRFKCRRWY